MAEILYYKKVSCPVSKGQVEKIVDLAASFEKKICGITEVSIVSENIIKKLNKKFRGKDKVTDVLSFSLRKGGIVAGPFFGELYICYPQIVRQAKEFGVSVNEEFSRMLVHGLLHLADHDHQKKAESDKMFKLQEKIITVAKKNRVIKI
ncbi:MAG: rRNA maturation RNase YbeY [Patescibacteria group bacterium]|jgi:probable rRNA maturation factor